MITPYNLCANFRKNRLKRSVDTAVNSQIQKSCLKLSLSKRLSLSLGIFYYKKVLLLLYFCIFTFKFIIYNISFVFMFLKTKENIAHFDQLSNNLRAVVTIVVLWLYQSDSHSLKIMTILRY